MDNTRSYLELLSDEVLLQILIYALNFPNGIHGDRWPMIKRLRVDPLLQIQCLAPIVPEALLKHNLLILKPTMPPCGPTEVPCPCALMCSWVQKLEFQPSQMRISSQRVGRPGQNHTSIQVNFLQSIANGQAGFRNLTVLRLVFNSWSYSDDRSVQKVIKLFRSVGPMEFDTKSLEIVVGSHQCLGEECSTNTWECKGCKQLKQLLSAKPTKPAKVAGTSKVD